jgi:hypothetical protein
MREITAARGEILLSRKGFVLRRLDQQLAPKESTPTRKEETLIYADKTLILGHEKAQRSPVQQSQLRNRCPSPEERCKRQTFFRLAIYGQDGVASFETKLEMSNLRKEESQNPGVQYTHRAL